MYDDPDEADDLQQCIQNAKDDEELFQRLSSAPLSNLYMVAGTQHIRHRHPAKLRRTRVMRTIKQTGGKRIILSRSVAASVMITALQTQKTDA